MLEATHSWAAWVAPETSRVDDGDGHLLERIAMQDAGVQVGDMVITVHNSVAMTPRALEEDLRREGLGGSGEVVVMKVRESLVEWSMQSLVEWSMHGAGGSRCERGTLPTRRQCM